MELNDSQLKDITSNFPSINVILDWEGEEGSQILEGKEEDVNGYLLTFDASINATAKFYHGDRLTQPTFDVNEPFVDVFNINLFLGEKGEEITLSESQSKSIIKSIENNVIV